MVEDKHDELEQKPRWKKIEKLEEAIDKAIDDSFKKNGALSIIPTKLNKNTKVLKHYWSKKTKDLHLKTNNKKTVLCEVKKGSIVVFSSLTPHSSGDNLTNKSRRAYLCQYTPFPMINKVTGIQNGRALLI